ncbi:hypothetical protein FHS27_005995 [Rhodopirellula rubra]|uniref:Uncharacterized protein n=1 Tax=Aporhodopirellula rubra TaxID=980271 RepID=A0A7W5E4R4_9BACT|nr:hypothetical protein [Aporhodopirellula rubra]
MSKDVYNRVRRSGNCVVCLVRPTKKTQFNAHAAFEKFCEHALGARDNAISVIVSLAEKYRIVFVTLFNGDRNVTQEKHRF